MAHEISPPGSHRTDYDEFHMTGSEGARRGNAPGLPDEHEIACLALRHALPQGLVLRSCDPLACSTRCGHCSRSTRRWGSLSPTRSKPPRRWSPAPAESLPEPTNLPRISGTVLANLHGPRLPRVCAHRVKSALPRWNKHSLGKPCTCQRITKITTEIRQEQPPTATRRRQSLITASGP